MSIKNEIKLHPAPPKNINLQGAITGGAYKASNCDCESSKHGVCICDKHNPYGREFMKEKFVIKDSGKRQVFKSGMVRDIQDDKTDFTRVLDGPMFDRWADHLTTGEKKYPDTSPGIPNWTLASGEAELVRFKESAFRHIRQWLRGNTDEDHAAAVFFNINGAEYVKAKLKK